MHNKMINVSDSVAPRFDGQAFSIISLRATRCIKTASETTFLFFFFFFQEGATPATATPISLFLAAVVANSSWNP